MGIPVEYSFHEVGPSQHEIDLRYTDALTMADNVMTFRLVVKEVAAELGVYATFMPKPIAGRSGLRDAHAPVAVRGRRQRLPRPGRRVRPVARSARRFIAGLLHHAREITAVTNQWVNSYKRLIVGLRGAGLHLLGPQQPLGARPGARSRSRARRARPASSSGRPTRPATRTSRSR